MLTLIDEFSVLVEEVRVNVDITRSVVTSICDRSQYADAAPSILDGAYVSDKKLIWILRGSPGIVEGKDTVRPVVDVRKLAPPTTVSASTPATPSANPTP